MALQREEEACIGSFMMFCKPCTQTVQYQITYQQRGKCSEEEWGGVGDESDDLPADDLKQLKRKYVYIVLA